MGAGNTEGMEICQTGSCKTQRAGFIPFTVEEGITIPVFHIHIRFCKTIYYGHEEIRSSLITGLCEMPGEGLTGHLSTF